MSQDMSNRPEAPEDRVDESMGGGLNNAAVQAAGLGRAHDPTEGGDVPGTADLGAAAGDDLGAGLGGTRGSSRENAAEHMGGAGRTRGLGPATPKGDDVS